MYTVPNHFFHLLFSTQYTTVSTQKSRKKKEKKRNNSLLKRLLITPVQTKNSRAS